jgi:transketolase
MKDLLMREVLVSFLREQLISNPKVVVLDADLGKCSGTFNLVQEFPDRVINVGVAEQNLAGVAAGLSESGFIPFIHSFAAFAGRRMLDQVMISLAYSKQNVKIIGSDPGISAEMNGGTHMPFEDVGALRSIPDIVIYEPTDNCEFAKALPQILNHKGLVYIRMFRKNPSPIFDENLKFDLFKATIKKEGSDVTLICNGIMVKPTLDAAEELKKQNVSAEVIVCPTVKPFDKETLINSARKTRAVVSVENHNVMGALRSATAEALSEFCPTILKCVGVKEKFGEVGKMDYLKEIYGMTTQDIVDQARYAVKAKQSFGLN